MKSRVPGLESPGQDLEMGPKAMTQAAESSVKEAKVWNTKNLGLRLASDLISGVLAASSVAPVITVIDK